MKVKMLVSRVGPGFSHKRGEEVNVPDAEGQQLVSAGQAVPVRRKRQKAVPDQAEIETRES